MTHDNTLTSDTVIGKQPIKKEENGEVNQWLLAKNVSKNTITSPMYVLIAHVSLYNTAQDITSVTGVKHLR